MNAKLLIFAGVFLLSGAMAADAGRRGRGRGDPSGGSRGPGVAEGTDAPDFELMRLNGKGTVKLSSFEGKKPVVLIFGSYT